jgi:hypothetical protein
MIDQDTEGRKAAAEVEDKYRQCQSQLIPLHQRIIRNVCQYEGKPYYTFDYASSKLQLRTDRFNGKQNLSINMQYPMIQSMMQKICQRDPAFRFIARNSDTKNQEAATTSQDVHLYDWERLEVNGHFREALALSALVQCDAFAKPYWDPTEGKPVQIQDPETGEIRTFQSGQMKLCFKDGLSMAFDPLASSIEECGWLIEFSLRPVDWVKRHYGVEIPEEGLDTIGSYQMRLHNRLNMYFGQDNTLNGKLVMVKEYWEAPSSDYPGGRIVTVAGGKVLDYKDHNPYGEFVHVQFSSFPVPGRIWSISPIQFAEDPQDVLNSLVNKAVEWYRRTVPVMVGPKGSLLGRTSRGSDIPFQKIEYDPTKTDQTRPWQYVAPPALGGEIIQMMQVFRAFFADASGMHEASQSGTGPQIRSGDQLQMAIEQDTQKFGPIGRRWEASWEKLAKKMNHIRRKFTAVDEIITITGKNRAAGPKSFVGKDLDGDYDIKIIKDSMMPYSQSARIQASMQLFTGGGYGPVGSQEALNRLWQTIGNNQYIEPFDEYKQDYETAQVENERMNNGEFIEPAGEWEDDDIHLWILNLERKKADFKRRPKQVRYAYTIHADSHNRSKMSKMGAQVPPPGIMPGAPAPPPPSDGAQALPVNPNGAGAIEGDPGASGGMPPELAAMMQGQAGPPGAAPQ